MTKKQIRPFDFSKLKQLSGKFVAISQALYEQYPQLSEPGEFAKSLVKTLVSEWKLPLDLKFTGMEEESFSVFLRNLSSPCAAVVLEGEPGGAKIVMDLDYSLSRMMVDRLLGGPGNPPEELIPLSPIEEGVLEFLILRTLHQIKDSPGMLGPVKFKIIKIVSEAKMLTEADTADSKGCVFQFYLRLGESGGYLKVFFPHPLLEGLFLREDAVTGVARPGEEERLAKSLSRASHIKSSLWSEIGRVGLQSSEKEALEKGDVILFDETFAAMGPHGVTGKAVLRVGENSTEGLLAELIDAEGKMVLKILDYYGGR